MKELSIKEKAEAYDVAIKKAKSKIKNDKDHVLYEDDILDIFSELKESEDEKIRKEIINYFEHYPNIIVKRERRNDWIAWLEKQGEQKPADKVEPKFHNGDWITNNIETVQITGYDIDYGYQVDYKGNLQHRDTDIIEKEYQPWLTPDQARKAVEIAREEMVEKACDAYCKVCGHYAHKTPTYICRQACDYYKDFEQAMRDE